jgi:hypothetical protein
MDRYRTAANGKRGLVAAAHMEAERELYPILRTSIAGSDSPDERGDSGARNVGEAC